MDLKQLIDTDRLPQHIAIIMDGNGRWAKQHGQPRVFGHHNGVKSVRETTEAAAEIGIKYLTLYAFSTENWGRPKYEVDALMTLLVDTLHKEIATLNKNNIRLQAIGDLSKLPSSTYRALLDGNCQYQYKYPHDIGAGTQLQRQMGDPGGNSPNGSIGQETVSWNWIKLMKPLLQMRSLPVAFQTQSC